MSNQPAQDDSSFDGSLSNDVDKLKVFSKKAKLLIVLAFLIGVAVLAIYFFQNPISTKKSITNFHQVEYGIESPQSVKENIDQFISFTSEEKKVVSESFVADWQSADSEYERYGAYRLLYSSLRAKYNVTKDPQIRDQMLKLEAFMSSREEWKEYYDASKLDGGFI